MAIALSSRVLSFSPVLSRRGALLPAWRLSTRSASSGSNSNLNGPSTTDLASATQSSDLQTSTGTSPLPDSVIYRRTALSDRYRPPMFSGISHSFYPNALSKFTETPKLVTLDCTGTIIQLTSGVGMFYREELFKATDCNARLPPPSVFSDAFFAAYAAQDAAFPCFGAGKGMSSEEWWRGVVRATYDAVPQIDNEPGLREELEGEGPDSLFDAVFNKLYYDVFQTAEGWELRPGTVEALESLAKWKASDAGPTHLGVISNFDERLHPLLENLGVAKFFDFSITSREVGVAKPDRKAFDIAIAKAGCSPMEAVHVGDSFKNDVLGAAEAGWHPVFIPSTESIVSSPASSNAGKFAIEGADKSDAGVAVDYTQTGDLNGLLDLFGVAPEERIVPTTRHITETGNDGNAVHQFD